MRNATELANCIDVAMRRRPADLVIKGARFFNLATGELERADLALCGERIAAVGEGYEGLETLDATGLTAVPGFVDTHCHIESSLLTPYAWERLVLPHGVTAAVCDPHELANVAGAAAIDYFRACAAGMRMPSPSPMRREGLSPVSMSVTTPSSSPVYENARLPTGHATPVGALSRAFPAITASPAASTARAGR